EGKIIDFCRSNNISQHQLFHRRKKLKKNNNTCFHLLEVPKVDAANLSNLVETSIKVEIEKLKIFIPVQDKITLLTLVRELSQL
ncbi:MAG: hypothetical protein Q8936_24530, partial [Bacillota bacterium]|nr:hypothetical protein [Bacillota bacterium]